MKGIRLGLLQYLWYSYIRAELLCKLPEDPNIKSMFTEKHPDIKELAPLPGSECSIYRILDVIVFSNLKCTTVPLKTPTLETEKLGIYFSGIKKIETNAFISWGNITELLFLMNPELTELQQGAFSGLSNLIAIGFSSNSKLRYFSKGIFEGLSNLKGVILKRNGFIRLGHIAPALNVKDLPQLEVLEVEGESIIAIDKDELSPAAGSPLRCLRLISSGIKFVDPVSLRFFRHLRELNLTGNGLNSEMATKLVSLSLIFGIRLESLSLRGNPVGHATKSLLLWISHSSVTQLDLSDVHFGSILPGFFPKMPGIRHLELCGLRLDDLPQGVINSTNMSNLTQLSLCRNSFISTNPTMLVPTLRFLDLSYNVGPVQLYSRFTFYSEHFQNVTHLEHLSLNGNDLEMVQKETFRVLSNLKVLLLSKCSIHLIEDFSFEANSKLVFLDLSFNDFPSFQNISKKTLSGLKNLVILDLKNCNINYLSSDLFASMKNLKYLTLRGNQIKYLPPQLFRGIISLLIVDLSFNPLTTWDNEVFGPGIMLSQFLLKNCQIIHISSAMVNDFTAASHVDLMDNPLSCDCYFFNNVQDVIQVRMNNSLFHSDNLCYSPKKYHSISIALFLKETQQLKSCYYLTLKLKVIITACSTIPLLTCLLILYYFMKWELIYWWYKVKQSIICKKKCTDSENESAAYKYDAFISYSHEDKKFVMNMKAILEGKFKFTLCLYDRDFRAGDLITEAVVDSVAASRLTIMVLSEAFVKSQWCIWEFQIAQQKSLFFRRAKSDSIIIIKLTDIDESLMTNSLRHLLKSKVYLIWGLGNYQQKVFWQRLKAAIDNH